MSEDIESDVAFLFEARSANPEIAPQYVRYNNWPEDEVVYDLVNNPLLAELFEDAETALAELKRLTIRGIPTSRWGVRELLGVILPYPEI